VTVYTEWEGRSPIWWKTKSLIRSPPHSLPLRKSDLSGRIDVGKSFVYVIFQDGTDIYWARSRIIEYLNSIRGSLPEGVNPIIGPTRRCRLGLRVRAG